MRVLGVLVEGLGFRQIWEMSAEYIYFSPSICWKVSVPSVGCPSGLPPSSVHLLVDLFAAGLWRGFWLGQAASIPRGHKPRVRGCTESTF